RQKKDQLRFTDPSFIRERLERAGLSPSLALQNGASSPGMSATIGSSSTPGGFGSSSLAHGSDLLQSIADLKIKDSQVRLNDATANAQNELAEMYDSKTPTNGNLGNAELENLWAEFGVKNALAGLYQEQKKGAITHREYEDSLRLGQDIENTFNSWNMDNRKELSDTAVSQSKATLHETIQRYDFNQSNNPTILAMNRMALQQSILNYFATEIRMQAEREGIKLTQAQTIQAIANSETLRAQANKFYVEAETENQMRGYRKAESVMKSINGFIGSVGQAAGGISRLIGSITTGGASELVVPKNGSLPGIGYPTVPTDSLGRIFGTLK
ncbi:MAG: hypothetical protein J6L75_04325, partial [Alistipes sp.]|nr:hypothetical protein [Alistipes sp.]